MKTQRRKVLVVGLGLVVLAIATYSSAGTRRYSVVPSPELRKELLSVRESVWKGWFENDQQKLSQLLPSELIAINNGQTDWEDREKTLTGAKHFAEGHGRLISLNFPRTEMQVYGDVAILYSQFAMEFSDADGTKKQSGRATEVFVRQNGRWVNTGWHLDSGN